MAKRTLCLSIPGLSRELLKQLPEDSALARLALAKPVVDLIPSWPAVTCSVQATLTTGTEPSYHGIVANGLPTYRSVADADQTDPTNLAEYRRKVSFWEQSNTLLEAPRVWEGKGPKTALLFFQHCMPGFGSAQRPSADIVLTPKPEHGPDGKITSLLWSNPSSLALELQGKLGPFPLMHYWGPVANLKSSAWIVQAAQAVWTTHQPDLQLTYIPHLDYDLQRFGPKSEQAVRAVKDLAGLLTPLLSQVMADGARVVVLSEYSISEVSRAIAPNRALLEAGLMSVTADGIDYLRSDAWVMCDHQIGHVYTRPGADVAEIRSVLTSLGLEVILPRPISHTRAGDTQVQAPADAWLDYRWWAEESSAPAWASTIDIHRKPGYDPLELFFSTPPKITTNAALIRGSHGRTDVPGVIFASGGFTDAAPIRVGEVGRLLVE